MIVAAKWNFFNALQTILDPENDRKANDSGPERRGK